MPTLGQIMRSEIGDARFRTSGAFDLREERVTAMKLATGAPCDSHGAMFAPWPGPEADVERWYLLESGRAVGVAGAGSGTPRLHLCDAGSSSCRVRTNDSRRRAPASDPEPPHE